MWVRSSTKHPDNGRAFGDPNGHTPDGTIVRLCLPGIGMSHPVPPHSEDSIPDTGRQTWERLRVARGESDNEGGGFSDGPHLHATHIRPWDHLVELVTVRGPF